jgi:redox-sensitive bicupin YhaK (pirin superfamily)
MVDILAEKMAHLDIARKLKGEIAVVVTNGKVREGNEIINAGQMLISKMEDTCCLTLEAGTRLLLFGGEPFPEERYMYWNFVSSSRERIEKAKEDWREKRFPKVPGDKTYIPLPGNKK